MTRLAIATAMPFHVFRTRFEEAAPVFDSAAIEDITARGGSWDEVRAAVEANAPNGLMVFSSIESITLMGAAGHTNPSVQYLLGNHVVAEQMLRYDPLTVLYAPLRVLVFADDAGDALIALDQPSTVFAGLNDPRITAVALTLDEKVADLLISIGVDAAPAFADPESP
jgi:uncharacterized protein (DUF302 family)